MSNPRGNRRHWLYRCFDQSGRLIYVGSTCDLFGRLDCHRSGTWWAPQVAKVRAVVHPNGPSARTAERRAIATELPRWNIQGKWATRAAWSEQDWRDYMLAASIGGTGSNATRRHLDRVQRDYSSLHGASADVQVPA